MGTTLRDYLAGEGRPKTPESARRRADLSRSYALAVDLIALRQAHGLTQQQLAERTGIAQSEISRIERGAIHPTDTTWQRLASALDAQVRMVSGSQPARLASDTARLPARRAAAV